MKQKQSTEKRQKKARARTNRTRWAGGRRGRGRGRTVTHAAVRGSQERRRTVDPPCFMLSRDAEIAGFSPSRQTRQSRKTGRRTYSCLVRIYTVVSGIATIDEANGCKTRITASPSRDSRECVLFGCKKTHTHIHTHVHRPAWQTRSLYSTGNTPSKARKSASLQSRTSSVLAGCPRRGEQKRRQRHRSEFLPVHRGRRAAKQNRWKEALTSREAPSACSPPPGC